MPNEDIQIPLLYPLVVTTLWDERVLFKIGRTIISL